MGALYDVPDDVLPEMIDDLLKLFGLYERSDYMLEGRVSTSRIREIRAYFPYLTIVTRWQVPRVHHGNR